MNFVVKLVTGLAAICVATMAGAVPITYTWQGLTSGSLNGESFTDTQLTITAHADTDAVVETSATNSKVFVIDADVSVEGIGSDFLTGMIGAVSNRELSRVGISNFDLGRAILFVDHPSVSTYDLASSFGPITGPGVINSGFFFPTTGGSFSLTQVDSVTFQAVAVPEPATWALMLGGLALAGVVARRTVSSRHRPALLVPAI